MEWTETMYICVICEWSQSHLTQLCFTSYQDFGFLPYVKINDRNCTESARDCLLNYNIVGILVTLYIWEPKVVTQKHTYIKHAFDTCDWVP